MFFTRHVTGSSARQKIESGIEKIASIVGTTLGAKGRLVLIERLGQAPYATKDGATVAKAIYLEDKIERVSAMVIQNAVDTTAKKVGDGTTTTTI